MIKTFLPAWQIDETLTLPSLLAKIMWANKAQENVRCFRVDYDSHSQQLALLFLPAHLNRRHQTAVFFTPGSWRQSNPEVYRFIGYFFARLGYPTILAGYRSAPAFKFPLQLEDACRGLEAGLNLMKTKGQAICAFMAKKIPW